MNFSAFVDTLPIIGQCLLGVFGAIGFIILVIYLLNKGADLLDEKMNRNKEGE